MAITTEVSNRSSVVERSKAASPSKETTSSVPKKDTAPPAQSPVSAAKDSVSIDRTAAKDNGNTDRVAGLTAALADPTSAEAGSSATAGVEQAKTDPVNTDPNAAALERIAEITKADHEKYGGQTTEQSGKVINKGVPETEDPLRSDIGRMWESAGSKEGWDGATKQPWSAAYISDVMKRAGVDNFDSSIKHSTYINGAIEARKAGDTEASHWGYKTDERAPQPGDLLCFARANSGATFEDQKQGEYASHCDIVTGVRPGFVDVIGGNVGDDVNDSVSARSFTTDENGMVNDPSKSWIAVLAPQKLGTE